MFKVFPQRDIDNDKYHKWRTRDIELTLDELISDATEILEAFEDLIDTYGFPYEHKMGYNYVPKKNTIEIFNVELIIVHIYQRGVRILEENLSEIICNGGIQPNYESILNGISGFGASEGIEQEMKARYEEYRGKD